MKGILKKVLLVSWILLLVITLVRPLFAGTTISGAVSCRVPYILTMADGTMLASEEAPTEQEAEIDEDKESSDTFIAEQESEFFTQQEMIVDNEEEKLINTVCAR